MAVRTIAKGRSLVISDMASDPATAENPICRDYNCRFYAGSPLTTGSGLHIGTFCLLDPQPNHAFTDGPQALLELLATTAVNSLELTQLKRSRERFHQHVLANISHELRTPIHGIIGLCELVADSQELSAAQLQNLTDARQQARETLSLVNDMLDFVKLDAGQLSLHCDSFHPHQLLSSTSALLDAAAAARLVKVRAFHPYSPKMTFRGDERRVGRVLTILLSNAIKFSKLHHYVELHVSHHSSRPTLHPSNPSYHFFSPITPSAAATANPPASTEGEQCFVYIRVADAGCGIAPNRLAHVFDRFYEEELQSFAPRTDGLGLGLAVCRLLTQLMAGELLVESKLGVGTVFHVVLPCSYDAVNTAESGIAEEERAALGRWQSSISASLQETPLHSPNKEMSRRLTNFNSETDPDLLALATMRRQTSLTPQRALLSSGDAPEVKAAGKSPLQGGLRSLQRTPAASATPLVAVQASVAPLVVLIVDDNLINLKVAARFLGSSGHVCVCVQSGAEALEQLQARVVDVVLMDLQMPEMDGLQCTRRIRELEATEAWQRSERVKRTGGRLPIIAVTASEGSGVEQQCLAAGMDACVFKPFDRQRILGMIAATIAKREGGRLAIC